ncbi:hypothetical protein O3G_MSEX004858 [Manduca sexta]|uniref:Uncharacterized protein n=1 Tax=Manduca sexta TaxID=7130 RepID=A0A921YX16_MANSE|nr:hypothetical protein O3G_MSEX004858 [Manduca sexta]
MSLQPLLIICVQACFIQATFSQCTGLAPALGRAYPGGYFGGLGFGNILGYGNCGFGVGLPISYPNIGPSWAGLAPFIPGPMASTYGGVGNGMIRVTGELPVAGTTIVTGQVPIIGSVQFTGSMPAAGTVIIAGSCGCGRGCGCKGYVY